MSPATGITPEIAQAILIGEPSVAREAARDAFLRSRDAEELFDWIGKATAALAMKHPKPARQIVGYVDEIVTTVQAAGQAATS